MLRSILCSGREIRMKNRSPAAEGGSSNTRNQGQFSRVSRPFHAASPLPLSDTTQHGAACISALSARSAAVSASRGRSHWHRARRCVARRPAPLRADLFDGALVVRQRQAQLRIKGFAQAGRQFAVAVDQRRVFEDDGLPYGAFDLLVTSRNSRDAEQQPPALPTSCERLASASRRMPARPANATTSGTAESTKHARMTLVRSAGSTHRHFLGRCKPAICQGTCRQSGAGVRFA